MLIPAHAENTAVDVPRPRLFTGSSPAQAGNTNRRGLVTLGHVAISMELSAASTSPTLAPERINRILDILAPALAERVIGSPSAKA
jgi:hypothetical protein